MIPSLFALTLRDDNLFNNNYRLYEQMIEKRWENALFWDFALISSERLRLIFQRHPERLWCLSLSSTRVPVRNDQGATLIWRGWDKPDDWGEKGHSRYNTDALRATRGRREGEGKEGRGRKGGSQHANRNARATILARWYREMIGTWKSSMILRQEFQGELIRFDFDNLL